jgi:hypothetical protein
MAPPTAPASALLPAAVDRHPPLTTEGPHLGEARLRRRNGRVFRLRSQTVVKEAPGGDVVDERLQSRQFVRQPETVQVRHLVVDVVVDLVPDVAMTLGEPQIQCVDVAVAPAQEVLPVVRLVRPQQARHGVLHVHRTRVDPGPGYG